MCLGKSYEYNLADELNLDRNSRIRFYKENIFWYLRIVILVSVLRIWLFTVLLGTQSLLAEGTTPSEFKRSGFSIGLRDISDNMVQFTFDGVTFRIPISQLYTILENNQYEPNEISGRFTMVGLWPGFEPKNRDNIHLFTGVPTENESVSVTLNRYCRASDNPEVARQDRCNLATGMQKLYDVYGWNTSFPQWYFRPSTGDTPPERILKIPNMEYQGYRIQNSNNERRRASRIIYQGLDEHDNMQFAECRLQKRQDHYNCTIWVSWRNRFYFTIRLREAFISNWQAIHATALERLESYIVTDETPPPPPNIRWANFP
jgi:hypothetical protein